MPLGLTMRVVGCPTPAHTRLWLPKGVSRARRAHADVWHIVGDVHYVALGLCGARTVLTIHDLNRLDQLRGFRGVLYRWLYFSLPLRRSRFVTAISAHTRDQLVKRFPFVQKKIQVIPDPLPLGFSYRPKGFNADQPRILQVGTAPHKNLERLVEAIRGRECTLHIIGRLSEGQRNTLERTSITYENQVDVSDTEIIKAYEQADLVTFVSLSEGFGMPIIEAQAIGRPVITSRLSPMREVAGEGALLVDPFSVREIRDAVDQIVKNEACRVSLIEAGLENVTRFHPNVVAEQYAELYRSVVAG
jgi:glycosyltransferase involved in cell wall biosynthesis